MNNPVIRNRVLSVACLLAAGGCSQAPITPSVRVVEEAIGVQDPRASPEAQVWLPGSDRLYRMGDAWVVRRETRGVPVRVSPEAQRLLLSTSARQDPFHHPAPLSQELANELERLRKLAAENRAAMEEMREATETLAQAAQELLKRNQALAEAYARTGAPGKVPLQPTPVPQSELP